jgi:hypothetical protein
VIYVGSGEGMQRPDLSTGDGIYKTSDGGRSWRHLGLRDGQQIAQIVVDPKDEKRLFVAVLGHPYGPNAERGVFRSTDGGESYEKVLYVDENTGASDLALDPNDPNVLYACLWEARQGPWENGAFTGPGSGLYKSEDGGAHWRKLEKGLPTFAEGLGRIGITVAPSDARRLYATVEAKERASIVRTTEARAGGASTPTRGSWPGRATPPEVRVHPKDRRHRVRADDRHLEVGGRRPELHGVSRRARRRRLPADLDRPRSTRGHDPVVRQGAVVTVNGGESWSSWYNQPTAQFYHVSTDGAFPYRVCGGQQESGSACVASRSDDGQITLRDWHPVAVEEYGYVAADPARPDVVYGGKADALRPRTGQVQDVAPRPLRGGLPRAAHQPVAFSPLDPQRSTSPRTRSGRRATAAALEAISPDLTRESWDVPANVGKYRGTRRAAVRSAA